MKERLDVLLVSKGFFDSREKAKRAIMAGLVFIGQERYDKAGTMVPEDADIHVKGDTCPYVSRGGLKLEKSIKTWDLDLVVSGNDLGGLVVVPHYGGVFGGSMGYFPEFVHGMSEKEDVKLFITSGLSAPKNLIPRLNNPPEIAVVDIDGLSREQM